MAKEIIITPRISPISASHNNLLPCLKLNNLSVVPQKPNKARILRGPNIIKTMNFIHFAGEKLNADQRESVRIVTIIRQIIAIFLKCHPLRNNE
jgi:hypothetical protein